MRLIYKKSVVVNSPVPMMTPSGPKTYEVGHVLWSYEGKIDKDFPVSENGFLIVMGHGINDYIPRECLECRTEVYEMTLKRIL